jgi:hypothetical protein
VNLKYASGSFAPKAIFAGYFSSLNGCNGNAGLVARCDKYFRRSLNVSIANEHIDICVLPCARIAVRTESKYRTFHHEKFDSGLPEKLKNAEEFSCQCERRQQVSTVPSAKRV